MTRRTARLTSLRAGASIVVLAPEIGGSIASFSHGGEDILRPASALGLDAGNPLDLAGFPMVPFAGRITGGRFALDGLHVALPPNLSGERDAIHGQGWRLPWRVAAADESRARLVLDHPASDWPWAYRAEQTFALAHGVLVQTLLVTNRSEARMPAGLGVHPYFPRTPGVRLRAEVSGVRLDPVAAPSAPPPAWDWRGGPRITAFVDHQFVGWNGEARIDWPDRGLGLRMTTEPTAGYLVVYAPEDHDHFCVEPVTHQIDAVNRSPGGGGHDMILLAFGETLSIRVRYEVEGDRGRQSPDSRGE